MLNLAFLIDLALLAGSRISEIYETDFAVVLKPDHSPVTRADTEAEAIILEGLLRHFPDIPVVAEESVAAGDVPAIGERFFLVDPLDGSKEFISRNGEFTVNIALVERGVPVAGVVFAPAPGRIWWGARGQGSHAARIVDGRVTGSAPIGVRTAARPLIAVGSRSHGSGKGDPHLARFDIGTYLSAGSSLKFCLVASGEADLYPRFSRTMEWDTAAGDAVLRAAGGRVTCLDGAALAYGKLDQAGEEDFANPHFIAYGDPSLTGIPAAHDQDSR